ALHPALLDASLHTLMAAAGGEADLRVPFELEQVWVSPSAAGSRDLFVHVEMGELDAAGMPFEAKLSYHDGSGALVATVGRISLRSLNSGKVAPTREGQRADRPDTRGGQLYRVEWTPKPVAARGRAGGCAVVGSGPLSNEVATALRSSGAS